jgi:hypothetical protein
MVRRSAWCPAPRSSNSPAPAERQDAGSMARRRSTRWSVAPR